MTQLLIVLYAYLYMGFQQRQGPQEIRHNGSREVSIQVVVAKRLYICTCNFGVDLYKIDIMYMHVI